MLILDKLMILSISDELSYFTPIKLRQEKFSPEIINKLNYSFIGKKTEEGRVSFFRDKFYQGIEDYNRKSTGDLGMGRITDDSIATYGGPLA